MNDNSNTPYSNNIVLPDIDIKKNIGLKLANKAVSLTLLVIFFIALSASIILFTVETEITIDSSGILKPEKIEQIFSSESGIIKNIYVKSGDSVKAGQTIASLSSLGLSKNLNEIKTDIKLKENLLKKELEKTALEKKGNEILLEKAKLHLIKAKTSFRYIYLGFYPDINADSLYINYMPGTHTALDYSYSEIKSAELEIENRILNIEKLSLADYDVNELKITIEALYSKQQEIANRIKHLEIKAPTDGIILNDGVENLLDSYVNKGQLLFEIWPSDKWIVQLFINEKDISDVKLGDKIKIQMNALVDSNTKNMLEGEVTSIAPGSNRGKNENINYSGLYRVTGSVKVLDTSGMTTKNLKYGYKVNGYIISDSGKIIELLWKYLKSI